MEITKFPAIQPWYRPSPQGKVTHQEVVDAIKDAGVKRLTDIKLFDVFSGEKLGIGMKVNGL